MKLNKKGFSLIELIIAIFIITTILSIAIVSIINVRQKGRDAQRVSDVRQIQFALEMYRRDTGAYPEELIFGTRLSHPENSSVIYLSSIPSNPLPRADGDCPDSNYIYTSDTERYLIQFCLGEKSGEIKKGINCASPQGVWNEECETL
jgi:prepilin-type N-terminal cleavage/methylation domain-containing protein